MLAAAIAVGVLWSNVLAYHEVWLAPRGQLAELETIGEQFAGQGPALMTDYRALRRPPLPARRRPRGRLGAATAARSRCATAARSRRASIADIDRFELDGLLVYRTLVLCRRSPSRPPSVYDHAWSGSHYEVWQRSEPPRAEIIEHLPLGTDVQPAAVPNAATSSASPGWRSAIRAARLRSRDRRRASTALSGGSIRPVGGADSDPGYVYPPSSGDLRVSLTVSRPGRYGVWLGGSFRGRVERLDRRPRGLRSARHRLTHPGVYTPLGEVELDAGSHVVELRLRGGRACGRAAVERRSRSGRSCSAADGAAARPVPRLQPQARSLCGRSLDWVEAVAG